MANEIKIKGTVEKVALVNGKALAQVTITVPATQVLSIPLGAVSMNIQSLQSALFGKNEKILCTTKKA